MFRGGPADGDDIDMRNRQGWSYHFWLRLKLLNTLCQIAQKIALKLLRLILSHKIQMQNRAGESTIFHDKAPRQRNPHVFKCTESGDLVLT